MEDRVVKSYLNCGVLAHKVTKEKNINTWPRDHSCDIEVKNVTAFCPFPKNPPRLK